MARRPRPYLYHRKQRGTWSVRWRENGRQEEDGGYETEAEAEDALDRIKQRLRAGRPGIREQVLVGDLAAFWWDTYVESASITRAARQTYRTDMLRILDTIGDHDANAITRVTLRAWRDQLAAQHSPRAANKALTALSSIYQRALERDPPLVERNPVRGVERMPEQVGMLIVPTRLQVEYLERTAPAERERVMIAIASRCGLRQSELLGLDWQYVQDDAIFVRQVAELGRAIRMSTKTRESRRVPLPPSVASLLAEYRPPGTTRGLVFPSPTDPATPLQRSSWSRFWWKRWRLAAAWVAAGEGQPRPVWEELMGLQWKNLRHHYASRLAAAGATLLQCSRWMGHSSITTTDRRYSFLFDEDEADVMLAID